MPRRLPVRPAKVFGNFFVLLVLSVIALIYYTFVFVVWGPRADSKSQLFNSRDRTENAIFARNGCATAALDFHDDRCQLSLRFRCYIELTFE